jgi:hypothetical protein
MGNDNSKTTLENQQLIMQMQQQLLQQQQQQQQQQNNTNNYRNPREPIISPAELQRGINPYKKQQEQEQNPQSRESSSAIKLLEILGNKELMLEIDKNPSTKRKLLEKLLNNHRHMMTSNQVTRITQMLNNLPSSFLEKSRAKNSREIDLDNFTYKNNNYSNITERDTGFEKSRAQMQPSQGSSREPMVTLSGFNQGTTPQDNKNRQLQTMQQLNTIDALTKHYKTEAEQEEAYFKIEEARRRKEFAEKQRNRRLEYQASLTELEKSDIDALRLFQLQNNYTIDDLKSAYKKLAMKTHPDKQGGSSEQFQLVTKCYMSLLEKYKNRESDKPFNDLRDGSKSYIEDQKKSRMKNKDMISSSDYSEKIDKTKFDNKLFNKIYEQNKLWESGDDGYGDWFTSNQSDEPPEEVFGNKFNINVFNSTFEDYKEKLTSHSGAIQEYKDPQELVSGSTGFTDIDIYARKINDFSKPLPVAKGGKNDLAYTDLKTAYTNKGAFIDPNSVEYKEYKNVDELKRDRSNIRYVMTPEQMRDYELKKRREIEEEEKRQDLIRQRDNVVSSTYGKIHEKMLGYKGSAGY